MLSARISSNLGAALRTDRPAITMMVTRALTATEGVHRVLALCKANSEMLQRNIDIMDTLINKHHVKGANKIYNAKCPITGTTLGRQFRHNIESFEKVALDGLQSIRDKDHKPIDLHYDHRDRGSIFETDICEARERYVFVQDVFNSVYALEQMEDPDMLDGDKTLTAHFAFPCDETGKELEFPLTSTLEREMGFVCHHAMHHEKVIKAMANAGHTGLKPMDLPPGFLKAPCALAKEMDKEKAA